MKEYAFGIVFFHRKKALRRLKQECFLCALLCTNCAVSYYPINCLCSHCWQRIWHTGTCTGSLCPLMCPAEAHRFLALSSNVCKGCHCSIQLLCRLLQRTGRWKSSLSYPRLLAITLKRSNLPGSEWVRCSAPQWVKRLLRAAGKGTVLKSIWYLTSCQGSGFNRTGETGPS